MVDDTASKNQKSGSEKAKSRASQVSDHLLPKQNNDEQETNHRPRRRRRSNENTLPEDYSDILSQIKTLRKIANTPDLNRTGYIRQKEAGKLWVRERIDLLLDKGSFREIGGIAGKVKWRALDDANTREWPDDFTPFNNLQGFGKLNGRQIIFTADDFSLRAGHADGTLMEKTIYAEKLAIALKLPMIKLVDGSSGGGSVTQITKQGFSYVPPQILFDKVAVQLNSGIPNLGAVVGPAIGLGAARVVCCHFSVMAGDIGSLFNAGPKVVAKATFEEGLSFTDLGGPPMHCTNGTIDNFAANERDAYEQIRTLLDYLPSCGTEIPPVVKCDDPSQRKNLELRSIVPRKRERMYDVRKVIGIVVDAESWFEIGALWGRSAIVGMARLGGRPIGIIANNPEVSTGALDAAGSQKITRHLKFCDVFNIPILQFIDVPGYAIGTVAERTATMRWGVELAKTYFTTTIPIFSVIVRKAYGVAGSVMADCRDPRMRVGWPSGEWGSLPLDGGIEVGHSAELRKLETEQGIEAKQARMAELDAMYRRLMNPIRTANHFNIEEIIDPATTRPLVAEWCRMAYETELPQRVLKRTTGQLQPLFA